MLVIVILMSWFAPTIAEVQRRDDEAAESILQEYRQPFIDKVNESY